MDTYTPKNILITGGAGFIASHVVILFVKKYPQYKIINLDKLDYCSSLKNLEEIENCPNYKFIRGNICSADLIRYILESENIDTILHFAAQTHVDNSFGNSILFTINNVYGTHVLLETSKAYGKIKRFIQVSTDEVYGEQQFGEPDLVESSLLDPTNPYAATKASAEFIAKSYLTSFNFPIIITRGNNVYGPHQYPEKVVPKFINQLDRGLPLTIHGNGSNTRNFLYVTDTAKAFDIICHKGTIGQIYNIAGNSECSILQVASKLVTLFGKTNDYKDYLTYVQDRLFNDKRYAIDSQKLYNLGWKQETDIDTGLRLTKEWYVLHVNNWENIDLALKAHPHLPLSGGDSITPFL